MFRPGGATPESVPAGGAGAKAPATAKIILNVIDYYNLLGVRPTARHEDIRAAFRRQAKSAHPDAHPHLGEAEKAEMQRRFIRLAQAYETLTHPERRRDYDRKLRAARMRGESRRRATPGGTSGATARRRATPGGTPGAGQRTRPGPGGPGAAGTGRAGPQGSDRQGFARPGGPPPGGRDEDLEDLLEDLDRALNKFGLSVRNQFGEMLDRMLAWAMAVFLEVMQTLEKEGNPPSPGEAPPGGAPRRPQPQPERETQARRSRPPPPPPPGEGELEAELAALKEQVNSAVARAEKEKATPELVEEELERIRAGLKRDS